MSAKQLPTVYQEFIALSRYARWLPDEKRRETWSETATRYISFFDDKFDFDDDEYDELHAAIYNLKSMPSMRALMTAGPALDRDNVAGFNCSYLAINRVRAFDELMYILACGTGVGFSCERQEVNQLPTIADEMVRSSSVLVVDDSKEGWASSFREMVSLLYAGQVPKWNVDAVRPKGAPLKTFGGRASGPEPLVELFKYTIMLFKNARGRKLTSIEVHGLCCKIAEIIVVGGVRRSALISLSNLSDERMRHAKSGQWWNEHPEYALANNTVAYDERPGVDVFMREWLALIESKSGERGIFNREAAQSQVAKNGRRDPCFEFGTNPCSEIILRDRQFCNLSEVVVREDDTIDDLKEKVRLATIFGTLQSSLTKFRYLSKEWAENTKEEALLGVSLTGIMEHPILNGSGYLDGTDDRLAGILDELCDVAVSTNAEWADRLGVARSTAVTCVKPSGTVSQLVNSPSGIHAEYAEHYIRTVRADDKDPLCEYMKSVGFPWEEDVTKPGSVSVFSFPMKKPKGSIFRNDRTALQQLELWLVYQRHWCEHKPSITVYVRDEEWLAVGAWVWEHFDEISGVSFLPYSDHTYRQAPYQEIFEDEYEDLIKMMPKNVDWAKLGEFEDQDMTAGAGTMACVAGVCEIVDLTS
jgi:ribonucleoside-triphosphate reductase (thioredoxin)